MEYTYYEYVWVGIVAIVIIIAICLRIYFMKTYEGECSECGSGDLTINIDYTYEEYGLATVTNVICNKCGNQDIYVI